MLRSAWTDAWDEPDGPRAAADAAAEHCWWPTRSAHPPLAHKNPGAEQLITYFVGQVVGSMNHVKSVRSVIEELVQEYAETMERLDELAEK